MYLKRLQFQNYGPLRNLVINFPFDEAEARPTPVLLVGKNGSGKTIALSHIVNAMVRAKDAIYQGSRELDEGKVFKIRSNSYVSVGTDYYYACSEFESGLFMRELHLRRPKHTYAQPPTGMEGRALDAWDGEFHHNERDHFYTNISETKIVKELVSARSLLYFPSNRAEEPAWLNQKNLRAKPQYTEYTEGHYFEGETRRRLIAHSPLRDIYYWLYDVAYDGATDVYNLALTILRIVISDPKEKKNLRFGIGGRHSRIISLESDQGTVVPNLFQLSSGEIALLALFLNILRDFDLREDRNMPFASAEDVKGLVVVDEVDLHLHVNHQHDVLPRLIKLFPNVQFVMTTHSPLFVFGMKEVFGEEGFQVYDLPSGYSVTPEDFDEFDRAFATFKATSEFLDAVREQMQKLQHPILFVEGSTDQDYLRCAACGAHSARHWCRGRVARSGRSRR